MPSLSAPLIMAAMVLCAGFSAALALIRAQPDDASRVQAFLSAGCTPTSQPCWAGILPGRTRFDAAITMLSHSPWVQALSISEGAGSTSARWQWSAEAPAFVHGPGQEQAELWSVGGVVSYIMLPTRLAYGLLEYAIGQPGFGQFEVIGAGANGPASRQAYFLAAYQQSRVIVETHFACPAPAREFWAAPAQITLFSASLMQGAPFDRYDFFAWMYDSPCPR